MPVGCVRRLVDHDVGSVVPTPRASPTGFRSLPPTVVACGCTRVGEVHGKRRDGWPVPRAVPWTNTEGSQVWSATTEAPSLTHRALVLYTAGGNRMASPMHSAVPLRSGRRHPEFLGRIFAGTLATTIGGRRLKVRATASGTPSSSRDCAGSAGGHTRPPLNPMRPDAERGPKTPSQEASLGNGPLAQAADRKAQPARSSHQVVTTDLSRDQKD